MADIIEHPFSGNPAALLRLVPRHLLNPEPILRARRDPGGETATHQCPWCGGEHTHGIKPKSKRLWPLYSRASHCDVFDELFGIWYGVWFYVEGDVSEEKAQEKFRQYQFDQQLGDYLIRDVPRVAYSVQPDPEETRWWRRVYE